MNQIHSVTARLSNGDIEMFIGDSIKGILSRLNEDGTWNTARLLILDEHGRTKNIIYTHHIIDLKFIYKETN